MRALTLFVLLVGCGGNDDSITQDAAPQRGRLHASWSLRAGGAYITCDDAGAAKVEIATYYAGGEGFADRFPCSAGEGTTGSFDAGDVTVYVTLLNIEDTVIAQAAYNEPVVITGGETTVIGPYFFDL